MNERASPRRQSSVFDKDLEAAIDTVGRDRVFDRARALGWSAANSPEKWVWWGIVAELRGEANPSEVK